MSKKSTTFSSSHKRPSTRSLSSVKSQQPDKYTFQSDDEDHHVKPILVRKPIATTTSVQIKRSRGRPPKLTKIEVLSTPKRGSISTSNTESDSTIEENTKKKGSQKKRTYEKPVTRRASRLVSQTNTPTSRDKIKSNTNTKIPKKRGRKPKMLLAPPTAATSDTDDKEKSKQVETENIVPIKRRYVKKKTLSTETNSKTDLPDMDESGHKLDEKELMALGSPQQQQAQQQQQTNQDEPLDGNESDDSVEFVWKGSSKMSIEILKRRMVVPKDEPRDFYSHPHPSDPTAQRKRAIIPRLTNFDALSGQPIENVPSAGKRSGIEETSQADERTPKKSSSVITLNNAFQNDFDYSYSDTGPKMSTTTATTTTNTAGGSEEKPRARVYAVKSTTMKPRQQQQQAQQPEIKRPKWMNDQQQQQQPREGKEDEEEEDDNLPPAGEEPNDYDYVPKGQYVYKRTGQRGRGSSGTFTGRRGGGARGRPPGQRRWDDDDDDYDQYEESSSRYAPRKQTAYRSSRPMYDMADDDDDYDDFEQDKSRRMSLTQAYRRNTNTTRPPMSSAGGRRIAINNGNHPIYKPYKSSTYRPTPATLGLSTSNRRTSSTASNNSRSPLSTTPKSHHIMQSSMQKRYTDDDYYQRSNTTNRSTTNTSNSHHTGGGNTFVAKINDAQLSEVANQSQIFFVNMPAQEQKLQQQQQQQSQQVLSVLASEQQQVLPVAVVQQAKVETPSTSASNASSGQTLAFTVKIPVDAPKQKKILPKPSGQSTGGSNDQQSTGANPSKPFAWSRPPGRIQLNSGTNTNEDEQNNKGLTITPLNTDLDTMEAAHVLATAADVTMAADARRKAQQQDDEMSMLVDETPSTVAGEETVQCEDEQKPFIQQHGTITANVIDENGVEHTVLLSTEEAQQLLGTQGAIIVDGDGQPISIQQAPQPQTQTFLSPFALDHAQLQALLAQAGIDPNTPLTIEQIDPNQQQQQQVATLCTSPGGTQYTVLTQGHQQHQQQFILQTTTMNEPAPPPPPPQPQLIAPKEDIPPPPKRRAFAVKSTMSPSTIPGRAESFDDMAVNERPRRKIFATKSTVTSIDDEMHGEEEGIIGTRAYHRNTGRK